MRELRKGKNSSNKSIKTKIRNIILSTVLSTIIIGCVSVFFIFAYIIKSSKTEQLTDIMNALYNTAVVETREKVETQSALMVSTVEQQGFNHLYTKEYQNWVEDLDLDFEVAAYNTKAELLFATNDAVFWDMRAAVRNRTEDALIGGSKENGIWYYKYSPVFSPTNQLEGYIALAGEISNQEFVEHIDDEFGVDATIFWNDVRVATTISSDNQLMIGTTLNNELSEKMLKDNTTFLGNADILGKKYLTVYKSFGNVGEPPIGIVFVGESFAEFSRTLWSALFTTGILAVVLAFVTTRLSNRWLEKNVVRPMYETTQLMTDIAEGTVCLVGEFDGDAHYREFEGLMNSINHMVIQLEDSKKIAEEIAYYDGFTGLPNRFHMLRKHTGSDVHLLDAESIIVLDLDDLNIVNDIYGRKIGDIVILELSKFILSQISKDEHFSAFRMGGGTFAIVCNEEKTKEELKKFVDALISRFRQPYYCGEVSIKVTASVGVAMKTNNENLEELYQHSELAMREVKKDKKNNFLFYKPVFSEAIRKQKELEDELRDALENGEFYLVYQPKYNLDKKQFDSFEALIRWNSPKRGLVSPADFIEVAEQSGLIVPIGNWVLKEACRGIKKLSEAMKYPYRVAVNISPVQINRDDFFKTVIETILYNQLESSQLELEITENLLISSFGTAVEKLRQLNVVGVSVAVDDFGKGYSSLAYLQELPIQTLKIDKLFIDAIECGDDVMVGDIIRLGHNLKMKIVAEGVESDSQVSYLKDAGCDSIQGYYYSKPLTYKQLESFLLDADLQA